MDLSQRYTLDFAGGGFRVLDHDNAGQPRSTDTLSGGETFLASVSLALELSEQIQREAGAVSLDSIFIDEGFGSLDPETLEIVTEAIESLPTGGRMVGIITHIPELTRRLPFRIWVEKSPTGSRYGSKKDDDDPENRAASFPAALPRCGIGRWSRPSPQATDHNGGSSVPAPQTSQSASAATAQKSSQTPIQQAGRKSQT